MITFKQFIIEVADKKVEYDVVVETADRFKAKARIKDRDIIFKAANTGNPDEGWDISFVEYDPKEETTTAMATGSGGEFEVAAFILAVMKEFVSRYEPDLMSLTAEKSKATDGGNTRAEVYKRLLKRHFSQYEIDEKTKRGNRVSIMYLRRKDG